MRARVLVRPKAGILDPQGQAVERALPALGFSGIRNVHVGRLIELDVEDPAQLPEMCERLLANPLIEDYEILAADDARGSRPVPDNRHPFHAPIYRIREYREGVGHPQWVGRPHGAARPQWARSASAHEVRRSQVPGLMR